MQTLPSRRKGASFKRVFLFIYYATEERGKAPPLLRVTDTWAIRGTATGIGI